jgi:hypothetical protein
MSAFRAIVWASMPFLGWAAKRAIRFDQLNTPKEGFRWTLRGIGR